MRYFDIAPSRIGGARRSSTSVAYRARYIAPCPAELPPPTTTTRRSPNAVASVVAADRRRRPRPRAPRRRARDARDRLIPVAMRSVARVVIRAVGERDGRFCPPSTPPRSPRAARGIPRRAAAPERCARARQLAAADAGREAQVVLDPRAASRPDRPGHDGRAAASSVPRMRRTPPPRDRPARPRRSRGRRHRSARTAACRAARRPGAASGLRTTLPSSRNSTGSSAMPRRPRRAAPRASGSRSTSSQRYGMRLPARKSFTACDRGDHWSPISRSPFASGGVLCLPANRGDRRSPDRDALRADPTASRDSDRDAPR